MSTQRATETRAPNQDIGDFEAARVERLKADRRLSMSERLARVHALSKQMGAVKGAARPSR